MALMRYLSVRMACDRLSPSRIGRGPSLVPSSDRLPKNACVARVCLCTLTELQHAATVP